MNLPATIKQYLIIRKKIKPQVAHWCNLIVLMNIGVLNATDNI